MKDWAPILVPVAAALAGVVLSPFLLTFVQEWFANRRKTIEVRTLDDITEFTPPSDKIIIDWDGDNVKSLVKVGFQIANTTGRTLRNFKVEVGPDRDPSAADKFQTDIQVDDRARFTKQPGTSFDIYEFEFVENNVILRGTMLSSYARRLKFCGLGDVELRRLDPLSKRDSAHAWERMQIWAALASVAAAVAALIGSMYG